MDRNFFLAGSRTKIDGKQKAFQAEKRAHHLQLLPSVLQRLAVL